MSFYKMTINIELKLVVLLILITLPTLLYSEQTDREASSVPSNSTIDTPETELLRELDQWLHKHGYIERLPLPGIDKLSQDELCSMAYENHKIKNKNENCTEILALYNYIDNTICIIHDLDINTIYGKSILLHELVHHYQYNSKTEINNAEIWQREQAALQLEKRYFKVESKNQTVVGN
jgi:hypothetical protein